MLACAPHERQKLGEQSRKRFETYRYGKAPRKLARSAGASLAPKA